MSSGVASPRARLASTSARICSTSVTMSGAGDAIGSGLVLAQARFTPEPECEQCEGTGAAEEHDPHERGLPAPGAFGGRHRGAFLVAAEHAVLTALLAWRNVDETIRRQVRHELGEGHRRVRRGAAAP